MPSFYNGDLILPTYLRADDEELGSLTIPEPNLTGRFNNHSASFEPEDVFEIYHRGFDTADDTRPRRNTLWRLASLGFIGNLDGNRSDELLQVRNDTPTWKPTLGFSHTVEEDEISGAGRLHRIRAFGPFVAALLIGTPLVL